MREGGLHGRVQAFDPEFRKPFPNVQRYWQTLQAQPNFEKVFGNKPLPSEPLKYTPPAKDAKPKEAKAPKVSHSLSMPLNQQMLVPVFVEIWCQKKTKQVVLQTICEAVRLRRQ